MKTRKLIDIDKNILDVLEGEAKKQNRSLKNFLEYTIEQAGRKLESPSLQYKNLMDEMLNRVEEEDVHFSPMEEIQKKYGF